MPLTGDAKRKYQADLMAKRRTNLLLKERPKTAKNVEQAAKAKVLLQGVPFTNEFGETVLKLGTYETGHEHYWGWVSQSDEGTRTCIAFQYGNRAIGGCGQVMAWDGKFLNTYTDGLPDEAHLIRDSELASEIQKRMPVTKSRG